MKHYIILSGLQVKFPHKKEASTRKMFRVAIATIVFVSIVIASLPLTQAYSTLPIWNECDGYFVRNHYTSITLGTVAVMAVVVS